VTGAGGNPGSGKPWGGRFSAGADPTAEAFTSSLSFDRRLWPHDIRGSAAWARALERAGLIDATERATIERGLESVRAELESGRFTFRRELEDIHMNVERRLIEITGPVGGKLHTGRSRNDQIALDERLYLKEIAAAAREGLRATQAALVERAAETVDAPMPGYTHLQRAQPIVLAHHLLAYVFMLQRDRERFADCAGRADVMPLGAAALAGTAFPIDREALAADLGFAAVSPNSLDAVSDGAIVIAGSNVLAVLPFFHIYGIMAFMTFGLMRGATLVTMPRFELEQYLELARKYEVPLLHVVPPILLALAKYPGELRLPKLRAVLAGAAPLSAELAAELTRRSGALVFQAYGLTEVAGATHLGSTDPARNKPGSIGALIGNAQARLVSTETGSDVLPGERGEVWVRGPLVMAGYFENPVATAETVDADGWLHTGDIGYVDADGDFFLVDRVKELIKYKGLQVAPAELEAVLLQHEAIADVAVYPFADEEAGEIPKAAIVLKPGHSVTAEALIQFVQDRVSPQKRVRAVKFVDQIPKSASGKILRRVLVAAESA
jgi:hypothetical protein